MKRILIFGLKDPAGGVEHAIMDYWRHFDHKLLSADFAIFGSDFSYSDEIEKAGDKVIYLPTRRKNPKGYKKKLSDIFSTHSYDAVWCSFSGLSNIDFLKYAKKSGIKKRVAHSHTTALAWGSPLMKYAVKALHYKNKLFIGKFATEYWACTQGSGEFMFGKQHKIRVIPNAIDISGFAYSEQTRELVKKEEGLTACPFVIGHIGRMCAAKNQFFLLDIFAELLKQLPEAKLLFVGDGELREAVTDYADQLKIKDSVIFTGARKDPARLYQAMDVFCLPSDNEGFPVTLIEAQAAGLPCAVSLEAVDKSTNLCGEVYFIPLSASAREWAEKILSLKTANRKAGAEKLCGSAYDINTATAFIQKFFLGD